MLLFGMVGVVMVLGDLLFVLVFGMFIDMVWCDFLVSVGLIENLCVIYFMFVVIISVYLGWFGVWLSCLCFG